MSITVQNPVGPSCLESVRDRTGWGLSLPCQLHCPLTPTHRLPAGFLSSLRPVQSCPRPTQLSVPAPGSHLNAWNWLLPHGQQEPGLGPEAEWVSGGGLWRLQLLAPCNLVKGGTQLSGAIHMISSWCGGRLAFPHTGLGPSPPCPVLRS